MSREVPESERTGIVRLATKYFNTVLAGWLGCLCGESVPPTPWWNWKCSVSKAPRFCGPPRRRRSTPCGVRAYAASRRRGDRRTRSQDQRPVPLMAATTELLRDYLAVHPRRDAPSAPLFCAVTLRPSKPTGKRATDSDGNRIMPTALDALADLSVTEAADRLVLDWSATIRHQTFYKAVFRPAVARLNRLGGDGPVLPPVSSSTRCDTPTRACASRPCPGRLGRHNGCPSGSRIGRQLGGPQVGSEDFIADSGRRHAAV
jgi:hypothetical protein